MVIPTNGDKVMDGYYKNIDEKEMLKLDKYFLRGK